MVICCSAPNCTNRQGKGCRGRVSFHRFPLKDPARLALWAASLQRNNWSPGPYSFLCSNHFSPDSFVLRMHDQIPLLKPTAVPSIFPDGKANRTADRGRPHGGGKAFAKKKLLPKRSLPPSCGGDLNNERSNQHNIVVNDDLEDLSSVFIHSFSPNIPSARKFISSLHSYSRPSLPPALQNVKPVGHMDDMRSTGHACTDPTSSENMTFYADVSDTFPSDAPQSVNRVQTDSETSSHSASVVPSTLHKAMSPSASGQQPYLSTGLKDGVNTLDCDQLTPHAITSLHSYCFPSKPQPGHQNQLKKKTGTDRRWYCDTPVCNTRDLPSLNPAVAPLAWMLGSWVSEQDGQGEFPTISSFQYKEEAVISHVGQPMLNFTFCASNPDTGKPLHRECGFIRIKPGTNHVAFISAQNTGPDLNPSSTNPAFLCLWLLFAWIIHGAVFMDFLLTSCLPPGVVEIEEGEVQGEQLTISSHSISRISFAKEPHVQQICRIFRLTPDGKLEQTVSMATNTQPLAPHLRVTYRKASS